MTYSGFCGLLRICGMGEGKGRIGIGEGVGSGCGGSKISGIWLIIVFLFRFFRNNRQGAQFFFSQDFNADFFSNDFVS